MSDHGFWIIVMLFGTTNYFCAKHPVDRIFGYIMLFIGLLAMLLGWQQP